MPGISKVSREEALALPNLRLSHHSLVRAKLSRLRDQSRSPEVFRILTKQITTLLLYEATQGLPLKEVSVATPVAQCTGEELAVQVGFVPVLRAGLGMTDAALEQVPNAQVWCLGMYRDERTLQPVAYYDKTPPEPTADMYFVLDIMLATGGSACDAINVVKKYGRPVVFVGLIAAPEGVVRLATEHPDVAIYIGALDKHLNERGYIVPGLGDAGDRYFNT